MTTYHASGTGRFTKPVTPAERDALVSEVPVNQITGERYPEVADLIAEVRTRMREARRAGRWGDVNRAEIALLQIADLYETKGQPT